MNKKLLFDSFSYLDEELIERSETANRKTRGAWGYMLKTAACFAVLAGLIAASFAAGRNVPVATPSAEHWDTFIENFEPAVIEGAMPNIGEGDSGTAAAPILPMIEAYKTDSEACYAAPKNGEVNYSMPLRGAMEEYGDNVRYRVVIDLFEGEQPLPAEGFEARDEIDRLAALGYTSGLESHDDHDVLESAHFTLHATYDQLKSFPPSDDYGYMLYLYAERVPDYDPTTPATFSPGNLAVDEAPADLTEFSPPAEETP